MKILSTKKLKPNQRDLLLGAGFSVVDYNAIEVTLLDFEIPNKTEHAIFTSQNGAKAFLEKIKLFTPEEIQNISCYCVGKKTEALLGQNGLKVVIMTQNSTELGDFIAKMHSNETFYYFCGNRRRDALPAILNDSKIELFEVKTYKTELKPRNFEQKWDGILFFSPSGVQSYVSENSLRNSIAFCIGTTTAAEAKKHTSNIVIANATSVESVIAKTVKTLKK